MNSAIWAAFKIGQAIIWEPLDTRLVTVFVASLLEAMYVHRNANKGTSFREVPVDLNQETDKSDPSFLNF